LREVWGSAYEQDTQTLRVFIGQLRRKLNDDPARPRFILTEPGVGYRFRPAS
jgi:two-component system, OmpR family, KDP operon response regulator KdpE